MDYKINFLFAFLLFFLGVYSVYGLKCHVCSSNKPGQEDCHEVNIGDEKYLTECEAPMNASCRILEQWVEFEILRQKHDKRTFRQCASITYDASRPCYYRAGFGGKVNVCNCIGDGCNEASRTASTLFMIISSLFLLKYLI